MDHFSKFHLNWTVNKSRNTILRKLCRLEKLAAPNTQRLEARNLALGSTKLVPGGSCFAKNTKNNILAHTLINLKALKHAKFNKGSFIMHKTIQNQKCMFKQNHKDVETNQSSSYRLADLHCHQAISGQNPETKFKHHISPDRPSLPLDGFWKNSRNTKNLENWQNTFSRHVN